MTGAADEVLTGSENMGDEEPILVDEDLDEER